MTRIVFPCFAFVFLAACNNDAGNHQQVKESPDSTSAGEVNYVMENNVKPEVKKRRVADSVENTNNTMMADTAAYVIVDTLRK